jgi:3-methylcrotonyl-CoA carboxylase alpha subunit
MKQAFFTIDGKPALVSWTQSADQLWVHVRGQTWAFDTLSKTAAASSGKKKRNQDLTSTGLIVAPMPGKILKVNVKLGESVETGSVLIVMEAMKMEYTLSAPFAGTLKELNCSEGQQVELGQKLVTVEPSAQAKKV